MRSASRAPEQQSNQFFDQFPFDHTPAQAGDSNVGKRDEAFHDSGVAFGVGVWQDSAYVQRQSERRAKRRRRDRVAVGDFDDAYLEAQ